MSKPLFAYFGTPHISTLVLDSLEAHGNLPVLVVTASDKPAGRGLETQPSPVKRWALERGIDVITPEKLRDPQFIADLGNTDWDVFIVAMYAKLIPKELLDLPTRGVLNVHPSLLPKFRGPSPVLSAILADERETGVTIMQLTEGMDEGPIVAQARIEIEEDAWPLKGSQMEMLLAQEGGNLLAEVLPDWVAGTLTPEEQDHTKATYTKKFESADALLDLTNPREAFLKIRAFDQSPRAYFISPKGKRVIVTEANWKEGDLEIVRVIPEGKKEMFYSDYLRGQN
ncbi:MAG: Methionyl-tRNA formyltransferase [Patescibacteria group bacterium]|nr:Methionyl-tRNA formyltransferase [Patescibacteria group bacterium]